MGNIAGRSIIDIGSVINRLSEESYSVPSGYSYTKDHEWVRKESEETMIVGITDYAAKMLHDIVYVTLPRKDETFHMKDVFGQVESVKTVSDMYMPVSGSVLESNERLTREPEVVSASPYNDGWMLKIKATNFESEMKELLSAEEYQKYIDELKQAEQ